MLSIESALKDSYLQAMRAQALSCPSDFKS